MSASDHELPLTEAERAFEQTLLDSARLDALPTQATEQAWQRFSGLLTGLAVSPAIGARLATPETARLARFAVLKWLVVGALSGSAATVVWFGSHGEPRDPGALPSVSLSASAATPPPLFQSPSVADQPASPVVAAQAPALNAHRQPTIASAAARQPAAPEAATQAPGSATLAAEVAALDAARTAIDIGAFDQAVQAISRYQRDFPAGVLRADAEVVALRALSAQGDRAQLTRRAKQFLTRFPNDPQAATVRELLNR